MRFLDPRSFVATDGRIFLYGLDIKFMGLRVYQRADGTYRPFLARAAPIRDEAGGVREWVGVCTDLADRYHSEADASALVETALDAIITINHAGRVVAFNPAAEHIFGYQRGQVLGQELADLCASFQEAVCDALTLNAP